MQAIPVALMAAGSLIQGVAGFKAGQYNRAVAGANAQTAEAEGASQVQRLRDASRVRLGMQLGAQAESGFAIGAGSAIDSLVESATNAELEAMEARRLATARATAYRISGKQAYAEGKGALGRGLFGAAAAVRPGAKADYASARGG